MPESRRPPQYVYELKRRIASQSRKSASVMLLYNVDRMPPFISPCLLFHLGRGRYFPFQPNQTNTRIAANRSPPLHGIIRYCAVCAVRKKYMYIMQCNAVLCNGARKNQGIHVKTTMLSRSGPSSPSRRHRSSPRRFR